MGGVTLGIIITACFFIFFNPLEKKAFYQEPPIVQDTKDTLVPAEKSIVKDTLVPHQPISPKIQAKVNRDSLVLFAKSLLGVPYLYGSTDPAKGFDCSGFITFVFNHFNTIVPRSSYEFANVGIKTTLSTCRPGDVILFTGTDPLERTIGHIGIVCDIVNGRPSFIHSSSGKANGVTITSMENKFYQERFISVNDLLLK